jgi:hypothetical protein
MNDESTVQSTKFGGTNVVDLHREREKRGNGANEVSYRVRGMLYRTLSHIGDPGDASGEAGGDSLHTSYGRQYL